MFDLKGKVAIVTGSEQGLGLGIAVGLAKAGADILGVGIGEPSDLIKEVEGLGRKVKFMNVDLTSIERVDEIIETATKEFGRVDILVNNAGMIRRADAVDFTEKDWDDVMDLNIKTLFFLSQSFAKQVIKQNEGGKIINIASMLSYQGGIRVSSYTASKSGVKGLTMLLANEWAKHGIQVNAIAPGYMATANTEPLRADEARNKAILERIPAGRWGTIEDLAGPAVFLASEASDYVNGYTLAVDGGWLSR